MAEIKQQLIMKDQIIQKLVKENDALRLALDSNIKNTQLIIETKPDVTKQVLLENERQRLIQENTALRAELNKALQRIASFPDGDKLWGKLEEIEKKIDALDVLKDK